MKAGIAQRRDNAGMAGGKNKLEIPEQLLWKDWRTHNEYVQPLELYNKDTSVKKFSFKLPKSKVFTFLSPKECLLFPGCRTHFLVIFKTEFYGEYREIVEISTQDEHYTVRLKALMPHSTLKFSTKLRFPPTLIKSHSSAVLPAEFMGCEPIAYHWRVPPPFSIHPERGVAHENVDFRVDFRSDDLRLYSGVAYCFLGDDLAAYETLQLEGKSELPQIRVDDRFVDFGRVTAGESAVREIEVQNVSKIPAPFWIERTCQSLVHFKLDKTEDEVKPGETRKIRVTFTPLMGSRTYSDRLVVCCKDSNQEFVVDCEGLCRGPAVSLNSSTIDFGAVKAGQSAEKLIKLTNSSDVETYFQFKDTAVGQIFSVVPSNGRIGGNSFTRAKVTFRPRDHRFYHNHLRCLVAGQESEHLGLSGVGLVDSNHIGLDAANFRTGRGLATCNEDIMNVGHAVTSPVEVSAAHVDFGYSGRQASQDVTVLNNSPHLLKLAWTNPSKIFTIVPEECTILPLKRSSFQIYFNPECDNKLYNHVLETFLELSEVDQEGDNQGDREPTLCSHYSLLLQGHTFLCQDATFTPKYSVFPRIMYMQTCEGTVSQVLAIRNKFETPLRYFLSLEQTKNFYLDARCGLIMPNETELVRVFYRPSGWGVHRDAITCVFNYSDGGKHTIPVNGFCEKPSVLLSCNSIKFPSTFYRGMSTKYFQLQNTTTSKLKFVVDKFEGDPFSITPSTGFILPHQLVSVEARFAPRSIQLWERNVLIKFYCISNDNLEIPESKCARKIRLSGESCDAALTTEDSSYEFPTVFMNEWTTCEIKLENRGDCDFGYIVDLSDAVGDDTCVKLNFEENFIKAKTSQTLKVKFLAKSIGVYNFPLNFKFIDCLGANGDNGLKFLCNLHSAVSYSQIKVVDIRCLSSLPNVSKKSLWTIFSLHNLDEQLQIRPQSDEFDCNVLHRSSCLHQAEFKESSRIVFDILGNTLDGDATIVELDLHNPGSLESQWGIYFPKDLKIDPEIWADNYIFTEEELKLMKDVEDELLTITPRSGTIKPGERSTVTLHFKHTSLGFHKIPLFLKILRGKEIFIDLFGTTLSPEPISLPCIPNTFEFAPLPLGSIDSTIQLMEILNGGSHSCYYQVNMEILKQLENNYYDYAVFRCLNPVGEIAPFSSCMLKWIFSPLEARKYTTNISICVNDSADYVTRLIGVGYDERVMNNTLALSCENNDLGIHKYIPPETTGQEIVLFPEHIRVGIVPINSIVRRLVFLKNRSPHKSFMFSWKFDKNLIRISPAEGVIRPSRTKVFRIELKSENTSILNETDLSCNLTDKEAYKTYKLNLGKHRRDLVKSKEEFKIEVHSKAAQRSVTIGVAENEKIEQNITKCNKTKLSQQPLRKDLLEPVPPDVRKINVRLTHRTMGIIEYESRFPRNINTWLYFSEAVSGKRPQNVEWTCAAKDMVLPILSTVIRCIISEANFINLINNIESEPIPAFIDLADGREPASPDDNQVVKQRYSDNKVILSLEKMLNQFVEDVIIKAKNEDFSITKVPFEVKKY